MNGRHVLLCGLMCLLCGMEAVRAGSEARNLLAVKASKPGVAGTSSTCVISGITYQAQCALYYTNIGDGIENTPAAALNVAGGIFPATGNTGFYGLANPNTNRLALTITGQPVLGLSSLTTTLFPATGNTGFFNPADVTDTVWNRISQKLYGADISLNALVAVIFPNTGNTGFFNSLTTVYNRISQLLYGADTGIGNLVKKIFQNYPVGTAGTPVEDIVDGTFVFTATAACPVGQYLMGGTAGIYCTATGTVSAVDLQKVASNVASQIEYKLETGVPGSISATYVATDATPYNAQFECGAAGDNSEGCECKVRVTPLCYNPTS